MRSKLKELPSLTSHSNWSLRTEGSVAGKRNFQVRDKEAETALEIQGRRWGDKTYSQNPADSGLIAGFGEISVRTRMRGGAERTRTACQARSRYRTGLSRLIRRGNSAIKCRRSRATTLSRKDWHAGAIGAVLSGISGAKGAPRSCPAGSIAEVGLRWCGGTPRNRTEDLNVKVCKEATDGVSASHRSNDKIIATQCWRS